MRPSRTDNFPSTWKELENKPQTLSLQVFRDEWRLGDGEIPAPGFENQFSKCQRVTYRPKMRAREPSRWRLGLRKPVDTAPSRTTDSLGEAPVSEPGNLHNPSQIHLGGAFSRARSDHPALLTLPSEGLQVEPAFMHLGFWGWRARAFLGLSQGKRGGEQELGRKDHFFPAPSWAVV